ncbi:hypothetical protein CLOHAE12215_01322 [Clostridium haemolyticum]|uniref:hypothetical protein n=1 Tax=Clostridium haemolyticum TaxID=84025 RepID=UPI001C3A6183|nr:hypothetical protein [Clostridium haemolyticum]CAG7839906.1 hypothetical protein CLOHAE12215_01322 [Clostridium haemolyticum]
MRLYHITTKSNAEKILAEGFKIKTFDDRNIRFWGNGLYFSDNYNIGEWLRVLEHDIFTSDSHPVKIEVEIPDNLKLLKLHSDAYEKKNLTEESEEFFKWVHENKATILPEIEKIIDKSSIYANQEALGYFAEKYCRLKGYDGIEHKRYGDYKRHKSQKYLLSYEVVVYNPEVIKPIKIHNIEY